MRPMLRIVVLAFAVLSLASLAGAWSCFDYNCDNTTPLPSDNYNCASCGVGTAGLITVDITTGPTCDGDGRTCEDDCSNPDVLRARSTISYYALQPMSSRDVLACEIWLDCDQNEVCKRCTNVNMSPADPPDTNFLAEFACTDLSPGKYQYVIFVRDVEDGEGGCPCNEDPCESACAGNCNSDFAWEVSCGFDW